MNLFEEFLLREKARKMFAEADVCRAKAVGCLAQIETCEMETRQLFETFSRHATALQKLLGDTQLEIAK
jgi:hypothetical protein